MNDLCRVSLDENEYQRKLEDDIPVKIDWSTAELVITERDGHDIWGYILSAQNTLGDDLTEAELEYWADTNEFYDRLYQMAWEL